jgi:transglutaminase-like putative cysteine protease
VANGDSRLTTPQGWLLQVEHITRFDYSQPAHASYNETRLTPLSTTTQTTLESRVRTQPPTSQQRYADYWANQVVAFDIPDAHHRLKVTGSSTVETHPDGLRPQAGWAELRDPRAQDQFAELLAPTPLTGLPDELADAAGQLRAAPDPTAAVLGAVQIVRDGLRYERGSTDTMTTASGAWAAGHGVCQDFVHLTLALLRYAGVPSRYVSGYVHPRAEAVTGETVDGESHAWVEAWTGGWWGIDPTNDIPADRRHIIVARGRDYSDVPPIKGVYAGPAQQEMTVTVRITRVR